MRIDGMALRAKKRAEKLADQRAQGIRLANDIFKIMMSNEDGWTLMVGMPSAGVMAVLRALPDFTARFSGSVAVETRRLHRAIGMSTWEIVMAHNVAAGDPRASTLPEFLAGPDPAD